MDLSEETKLCTNCKRHISVANFLMHQVHCQRNIVLCPNCHEPVPRQELTEHFEELHVQISCDKCGLKFEKRLQEEHEKNGCPERLVKCSYCEIECPSNTVSEHENYCGSRTENCNKCKQYVMLKHQDQHEKSNCTFPEQRLPLNNLYNNGETNDSGFRDIEYRMLLDMDSPDQYPFVETFPLTYLDASSSSLNSKRGPSGDIPPLQSRIADVKPNRTSQSKRTNDMPQINTSSDQENIKKDNKRIFQELQNEEQFTYLDDDEDNFEYLNTSLETDSPAIDISVSPLSPSSPELNSEYGNDIFLPCEFCGELLPEDSLIEHQSGCRPDIAHMCIKMNNTQENSVNIDQSCLVTDNRQKTPVQNIPRPTERAIVDNLSQCSITESSKALGSEDICLPCEFCEETYPIDILLHHQSVCELMHEEMSRTPSPVGNYDGNKDDSFPQPPPKVKKELLSLKQSSGRSRRCQEDPVNFNNPECKDGHPKISPTILKKEPKVHQIQRQVPIVYAEGVPPNVKLKKVAVPTKSQTATKSFSRQNNQSRSIDGAFKNPQTSRNHAIPKKVASAHAEENFKSALGHESGLARNHLGTEWSETISSRDNKSPRIVKMGNSSHHISGARPKKSSAMSPDVEVNRVRPNRPERAGSLDSPVKEDGTHNFFREVVPKQSKSSVTLVRRENQESEDGNRVNPRRANSSTDSGAVPKERNSKPRPP